MLTACQSAIVNGDIARLASELKTSGDPDQPDKDGLSLLMWAVLEGNESMVKLLVENGASLNFKERKLGYTALHFAAQQQLPEIVDTLVAAGADIEAKDNYGNSPLFRATFYSNESGETIRALLHRGANPNSANDRGVTPLSLAKLIANFDVAQYFDRRTDEHD